MHIDWNFQDVTDVQIKETLNVIPLYKEMLDGKVKLKQGKHLRKEYHLKE